LGLGPKKKKTANVDNQWVQDIYAIATNYLAKVDHSDSLLAFLAPKSTITTLPFLHHHFSDFANFSACQTNKQEDKPQPAYSAIV